MSGGEPRNEDRLVGAVDGAAAGATVLLIAGMHGNEPAGILAIQRVLAQLASAAGELRGRVVGVAGNLGALAQSVRFIDEDLNRIWTAEKMAVAHTRTESELTSEQREQRAIQQIVMEEEARSRGNFIVVDLHSTSATSPPFICISDTPRARRIARHVPVPLLLGLEEVLYGTLLDWLESRDIPALLAEGGAHDAEHTADSLARVVWRVLDALEMLTGGLASQGSAARPLLEHEAAGVPQVMEVRYRHSLLPGQRFRMDPGFHNFDRVARGQRLASDAHGSVVAPIAGMLLMPLYQRLGDDGFFIARPFSPVWLPVSTLARRSGLGAVLAMLPGVQRDSSEAGTLLVNPRVARWLVRQLFHLAGYRQAAPRNERLVFKLRKP